MGPQVRFIVVGDTKSAYKRALRMKRCHALGIAEEV